MHAGGRSETDRGVAPAGAVDHGGSASPDTGIPPSTAFPSDPRTADPALGAVPFGPCRRPLGTDVGACACGQRLVTSRKGVGNGRKKTLDWRHGFRVVTTNSGSRMGDAPPADRHRRCNTSRPPDDPGKERCCRDDPLVLLGNPRFQGFGLHDLGFRGRAVIVVQ